MQPFQLVTSGNIFKDAESMTQRLSSNNFLPPLPKKRICKSYKTIELSDSKDDDERKARDSFKKIKNS